MCTGDVPTSLFHVTAVSSVWVLVSPSQLLEPAAVVATVVAGGATDERLELKLFLSPRF